MSESAKGYLIAKTESYSFGDYTLTASTRNNGQVIYNILADELDKFTPDLTIYNADRRIEIHTAPSRISTAENVAEQLAGLQNAIEARAFFMGVVAVIERGTEQ